MNLSEIKKNAKGRNIAMRDKAFEEVFADLYIQLGYAEGAVKKMNEQIAQLEKEYIEMPDHVPHVTSSRSGRM